MILSPAFHLQEHTNLIILMDAKQLVRALFLLRLFEPFVFYSHCTIHSTIHNNHRHHVIFLVVFVSQTNQGQTAGNMGISILHHHILFVF